MLNQSVRKPELVRVDMSGEKPVYHWRYEAPDGFLVEFTSGSLHLEGFQEYIIRRKDGVRAFVWGADTSIIHDYISEMDGNWEIEVAYPTHFQVVGYAEGFPMKSVHKELVALFAKDSKDLSTGYDEVLLALP